MSTFAAVLSDRLRREGGRPLVTFHDHATGEWTELSVTTYANWVAKASSLLVEEGDAERGQGLHLDLPPHWLATVVLGAAWNLGMRVTGPEEADVVVCGPDSVETWAGRVDDVAVFACSLLPMGVRFSDGVPAGVHDVGVEIWSQPDSFVPWDPADGQDAATDAMTQAQMWETATAGSLLTDGGRLLSVANPASPPGVATFTEPLVRNGSLVLVRNPDPARLDEVFATEHATHRG